VIDPAQLFEFAWLDRVDGGYQDKRVGGVGIVSVVLHNQDRPCFEGEGNAHLATLWLAAQYIQRAFWQIGYLGPVQMAALGRGWVGRHNNFTSNGTECTFYLFE